MFGSLRKPNGETIKADLGKSVSMVLKSSKAFALEKNRGRYTLIQPGCTNILKAERKANIGLRQTLIFQETLDK